MSNAGDLFSDERWQEVVLSLKEAAAETLPDFVKIIHGMDDIDMAGTTEEHNTTADASISNEEMEAQGINKLEIAITDAKCRTAVQLLLIQSTMEVYNMHRGQLSASNTMVLVETLHSIGIHAHRINSDHALRSKVQELGTMAQMPDPPLLRLESESYQASLNLLQNLIIDRSLHNKEVEVEAHLVEFCEEVLHVYLETASSGALPESHSQQSKPQWIIPLGSAKRRELASRAPLVVATLQAISGLKDSSFERSLSRFFPLLANLISCEHGSGEVQLALSDMLSSWVGPILLQA